ncbi:MAG: hypothetical protein M0C28_45610 [Candidatus Moduliflexus flocculans]|nr:hypothetical protein [Candidatus Moduliflexus flocculans]
MEVRHAFEGLRPVGAAADEMDFPVRALHVAHHRDDDAGLHLRGRQHRSGDDPHAGRRPHHRPDRRRRHPAEGPLVLLGRLRRGVPGPAAQRRGIPGASASPWPWAWSSWSISPAISCASSS